MFQKRHTISKREVWKIQADRKLNSLTKEGCTQGTRWEARAVRGLQSDGG